ncbi:MAG: DNA-processing protein DprA [Rhodoglobus sp.]
MPNTSLTPPTCLTLDDDTAARIALAVAGVAGDMSVAIAIDAAGGAAAFVAAVHDRQDGALPLSNLTRQRIRTLATGNLVAQVLAATREWGLSVLTPRQEQWPTQLVSLGRAAPLLLWVRGDATSLACPSACVTGTAAPTSYGIHMALELGTGLAQRGWVIAAGAGSGIDHLALRAAAAMNGQAVAVSAASIDRVAIPQGVTVISEVPPTMMVGVRSQRRAKQLLAAVTTKTILVEAGLSSAAVRTAEAAYAMGRPVGVVPGPASSPFSSGCHALVQRHGVPLVTSIGEADRLR